MLKRKDKILISAIELLEKEGTNGITTKNLAKLQGISEPALYRQYKNKQEIINAIINEYASYDDRIMDTITQSELIGKEAILYYITRYLEIYQSYSGLTTIMFSMDLFFYNEVTKEMMYKILEKRKGFLIKIISNSDSNFYNSSMFSKEDFALMINETIFAKTFEWRIQDKSYDLKSSVLNCIEKYFV